MDYVTKIGDRYRLNRYLYHPPGDPKTVLTAPNVAGCVTIGRPGVFIDEERARHHGLAEAPVPPPEKPKKAPAKKKTPAKKKPAAKKAPAKKKPAVKKKAPAKRTRK